MTSSTAEFIRLPAKLRWLKPLFEQLEEVITEYVGWEEQPPYFNNEAASVSLLVAAGSRSRYIVFSDYRTAKKVKGKNINGRCDLLIDKRNGPYLTIEAKQIYVYPGTSITKLRNKLRQACSNAKRLSGG